MSQSKKRRAHTQQAQPSCDVFISYRRDGGDMTAMYFYKALKERGYRVFYDLAVLRSGSFNEALLHSIRSCTDFVLILSPHALDRCAAPDDWVRAEIAEALRLGKNIIPIMLKDFTFPEYLPEDIDAVRYQNGLTSTTEYFNESINRVCSRYLLSKPVLKKKKSSPVVPILLSIAAVLLLAAALVYWYMDNKKPPVVPPGPPAPQQRNPVPDNGCAGSNGCPGGDGCRDYLRNPCPDRVSLPGNDPGAGNHPGSPGRCA